MAANRLENLLNWAKKHDVQIPEGLRYYSDELMGLSCVAEKDILSAQFSIPSSIIITGELARKHFGAKTSLNTWLKFLLAKMKFGEEAIIVDGEDIKEKFAPYLDCLPDSIDTPIVWNPSELQLLKSTNLGSSLREKLYLIFREWKHVALALDICNELISDEISICDHFMELSDEEVYEKITSQVFGNDQFPWFSFRAFLWAHLIFLSRAFPEYVLNPSTDTSKIMLLPVIDLLNHNYNAKVEWLRLDDSFCVRCLMPLSKGQEVLNNYGGKGNEELLTGYGFVMENNVFDTVALRIKLPTDTIANILQNEDIVLPTLTDYTRFAFEDGKETHKSSKDVTDFEDGVLYLISKENDISLGQLLDLFAFVEKNSNESRTSLRAQLQGLQKLRLALEYKLDTISAGSEASSNSYPIKPYRKFCADVYRKSQRHILKHNINSLKRIEKEWTSTHKSRLVTVKKILKADSTFFEEDVPNLFGGNLDVTFTSYNHILMLWIIWRSKNSTCSQLSRRYDWVFEAFKLFNDQYHSDILITPETRDLYKSLFPNGSEKICIDEVAIASSFISSNSYTRISNDESILVQT